MSKPKRLIEKENVVQAIVVADTFDNEFVPLSDKTPHVLLPVLNKPIIDYTLNFLSLGGIEETFLFCCSHTESIKEHINKCIKNGDDWTSTMKVNVIISESCHSFGDCLRDIDAKGLLRGNFVLLEPGVISNIPLLPLLKQHSAFANHDKGAAMTLILQDTNIGHIGRCPEEEYLIAVNSNNRILFHKKLGTYKEKKIAFPLEMFLQNPYVRLLHNIKDTHIAICSSFVLPLFSDNFDYQTKDDFVRGLLMNEEIMGSTIYCHILKGSEFGGAVSNWRMYQALSQEIKNNWVYPIKMSKRNKRMKNDVVIGEGTQIDDSVLLDKSVLGCNVSVGKKSKIQESFVFSGCKIEDNVVISNSIIGFNCTLKSKCKVSAGSVIGEGSIINKGIIIENSLVQSEEPSNSQIGEKRGDKAYALKLMEDSDEEESTNPLMTRLSKLSIFKERLVSDSDSDGFSDSDDDRLSHIQTPPPDDTKLFYTEVVDSLTRGFDEKLSCDNLILEINSSRYAYNVTIKEVNFHVVKAILNMSLKQFTGAQYYSYFSGLLSFFAPILKNYIRNESAMIDCLQAVEDVATSNEELKDKWVMFVLKYLYDKDFISEDSILHWFATVDEKTKLYRQVKPFADWLTDAEEASSSEDEESD